jgi:hypothetical protein
VRGVYGRGGMGVGGERGVWKGWEGRGEGRSGKVVRIRWVGRGKGKEWEGLREGMGRKYGRDGRGAGK